MFPGIKVKIGEEEIIIPPLSLGQLRKGGLALLQEHDKLLEENKHFEATITRGEIILMAIRRNYPDFSEDKVFDHLDLKNSTPLWQTVLGGSGFVPGETEAVKTSGT